MRQIEIGGGSRAERTGQHSGPVDGEEQFSLTLQLVQLPILTQPPGEGTAARGVGACAQDHAARRWQTASGRPVAGSEAVLSALPPCRWLWARGLGQGALPARPRFLRHAVPAPLDSLLIDLLSEPLSELCDSRVSPGYFQDLK